VFFLRYPVDKHQEKTPDSIRPSTSRTISEPNRKLKRLIGVRCPNVLFGWRNQFDIIDYVKIRLDVAMNPKDYSQYGENWEFMLSRAQTWGDLNHSAARPRFPLTTFRKKIVKMQKKGWLARRDIE